MQGIRLIRLLDVLPVSEARNAEGVYPRSLIVRCDQMEAIDQVLFNGMSSPSFAVYAPGYLIAEVPEDIEDAIITEVMVLSALPTYTRRSVVDLGVGTRIAGISGRQRLIQTFVRMLLRTSGSNIFHRQLGGSLRALVGDVASSRVAADVSVAVSNVKQQIIAAQTPYISIPPEERLLGAEISGVSEDSANSTLYCTVVLTSHERRQTAATFAI